ncbi:cation diffusion facilitator family transporter [Rhodocista pekingensis]|uniref:Cation diffusion facilitator family transporter n=1 Tax=Rhodocista pekingensis TaxID=201185 RepID=A0ABW2KSM9_9PROT
MPHDLSAGPDHPGPDHPGHDHAGPGHHGHDHAPVQDARPAGAGDGFRPPPCAAAPVRTAAPGHGHGHDHSHGHGHGHGHGHSHGLEPGGGNEARVRAALLLTGGFMLAEVVGGLLSGSLALLADAGHMLADTAALALAWYAFRAARRPAGAARTYGGHRFQVLAAFINGAALLLLSLWIIVEAARRLFEPVPVLGGPMLAIAALGLAVNIASFTILNGGDKANLNVRGAALHVLGDLLGSVAALAAAAVILTTGWTPIDPILSAVVSLLILRSAWALVTPAWHVLMEGTPEGLDLDRLQRSLQAVPGVADIHHVHAWSLTPEQPLLTLHATVAEGAEPDSVLRALTRTLREEFGIGHATIQVERHPCADGAATPAA